MKFKTKNFDLNSNQIIPVDEFIEKVLKNIKNNIFGDEIFFSPSRVLMQDYTGVPAIADLAAMRDKMLKDGKNPEIIN